jgi:hypothetical protein
MCSVACSCDLVSVTIIAEGAERQIHRDRNKVD